MELNKVYCMDCVEGMRLLDDNSVDSVVTDPPYGLSFMGKKWDYDVPKIEIWQECLRVLKPGGFLLSFSGTRTYHKICSGIEDAGFEIRDMISWCYGVGFPKSLNIGKAIDKLNGKRQEEFISLGNYIKEQRLKLSLSTIQVAELGKFYGNINHGGSVANWEKGSNVPTKEQWIILKRELKLNNHFDYIIEREEAEREVIGKNNYTIPKELYQIGKEKNGERDESLITVPSTDEAKQWGGWGTALKPAVEPIVVARKPLSEKSVALNVLKWGTGGINIDECRIGTEVRINKGMSKNIPEGAGTFRDDNQVPNNHYVQMYKSNGRFPANIILDEGAGRLLDEQSGISNSKQQLMGTGVENIKVANIYGKYNDIQSIRGHNDRGGASRFFYCAKASKSERNKGCERLNDKGVSIQQPHNSKSLDERYNMKSKNNHPTVKPIKLMEYLVRLVTRKGGVVLDPFGGSGSTGIACVKQGFKFILFDNESEYCEIARARLKPYMEQEKIGEWFKK